jgi:hypothetical protein
MNPGYPEQTFSFQQAQAPANGNAPAEFSPQGVNSFYQTQPPLTSSFQPPLQQQNLYQQTQQVEQQQQMYSNQPLAMVPSALPSSPSVHTPEWNSPATQQQPLTSNFQIQAPSQPDASQYPFYKHPSAQNTDNLSTSMGNLSMVVFFFL